MAISTAEPATIDAPRAEQHRSRPLHAVLLTAALVATGLMAGFFYAYHVSVTRGLALVSDTTYVETMTAINATVRNAEFGLAFFGAVPLGVAALATARRRAHRASTILVAVGFLLYLATVVVTFSLNVPLNDQLAEGLRNGIDAATLREQYEAPWNAANALRTGTNLLAFTALGVAAVLSRRPASS